MAEKNSAQTNRKTDTTEIMVTWPWTNSRSWSHPECTGWNKHLDHRHGSRKCAKFFTR